MSHPAPTKIADAAISFVCAHRSLMMATITASTEALAVSSPHVSHVPFAIDDNGALLVLVSELSTHTANLLREDKVSVMIIENEQLIAGPSSDESHQDPFARVRLTLDGVAERVDRNAEHYSTGVKTMRARLGETVDVLTQLPDFHLIKLKINSAVFVRGFAQAHKLDSAIIASILKKANEV